MTDLLILMSSIDKLMNPDVKWTRYGRPDIAGIMIGINDNLQGQVNPGMHTHLHTHTHTHTHTHRGRERM